MAGGGSRRPVVRDQSGGGGGGSGTVDVVSNVATGTILGRTTAGSGDSEELTPTATKTLLGLVIGTNVQQWDADLDDIAALADADGDIIIRGAAGWERLAKSATATHVLTAGATRPGWAAAAAGAPPVNDDATVATSEGTTSTTFTDLATAGPAVTVVTGTKALVIVTCDVFTDTVGNRVFMAPAVSGATTLAAADAKALASKLTTAIQTSFAYIEEGLTAGSNTFTAKYRSAGAGNTGTFLNRRISVINMGS